MRDMPFIDDDDDDGRLARPDSLARRLLRRVLLLGLTLGLAVTALQAWLNWRSESGRQAEERASLMAAYTPGIGKAVWDLDETALAAQLSGMRRLPVIQSAEVVAPQLVQRYDKAGAMPDPDSPLTRQDLLSPDGGQVIGTLSLQLDRDLVRQRVLDATLRFLWVWVVQTVLLAWLVYALLRRQVSNPLRDLSAHVATLTRQGLSRPAPSPSGVRRNELHQLAQGITALQRDLQQQLAALAGSVLAQQQQREEVVTLYAQQQRQLDEVLLRMADGAGLLDGDGTILLANPAWAALVGEPDAAPLVNRRVAQWLQSPSWPTLIEQVRPTGAVAGVMLSVGGGAEPARPVQASLSVLERNVQGEPQRLQIVLHDMQARVELERSLIAAREAALAATRAKSEFLANMSHEIRTPMNAVLGFTELTLFTPLDAHQRDYVSKIHTAAHSLLGVLNDILDFSKIEAGKLAIVPAPFVLQQVIEDVRSLSSVQAHAKGLRCDIEVADDVPAHLMGDALRLRQVLVNLCSNAVKFTPAGRVSLQVDVVDTMDVSDEGTRRATLRFTVADTGIGMDAATLASLFKPFQQADGSITRRHGGTGLGLAISQQLVGLMGGHMAVASVPGAGSTFSFTLCLGVVDAPPAPMPAEAVLAAQAGQLNGLRVLLVEDNPINQEVACELMRGMGVAVTVAAHGRSALECLSRDVFDLVLMDVQMPEMDGYEATRCIRAEPRWADLPVVALTAHALDSERARCLRAGMDDFLSKPFDPGALFEILLRWRGRRHETATA